MDRAYRPGLSPRWASNRNISTDGAALCLEPTFCHGYHCIHRQTDVGEQGGRHEENRTKQPSTIWASNFCEKQLCGLSPRLAQMRSAAMSAIRSLLGANRTTFARCEFFAF